MRPTRRRSRARQWWGGSVTEPALGTAVSSPRVGLTVFGWEPLIGERLTFITIEYGTFEHTKIQKALREDHWLHNYSNVDWTAPQTQRIKQQLRKAFYPDTEDWREAVLFRSRQVIRQALVGLSGQPAQAWRRASKRLCKADENTSCRPGLLALFLLAACAPVSNG